LVSLLGPGRSSLTPLLLLITPLLLLRVTPLFLRVTPLFLLSSSEDLQTASGFRARAPRISLLGVSHHPQRLAVATDTVLEQAAQCWICAGCRGSLQDLQRDLRVP
jgi:hypothetical protein